MTSCQIDAVNNHLGTTVWYEHDGIVYQLLGNARTDVTVTAAGNVRLGCRTLVRCDGRRSAIR